MREAHRRRRLLGDPFAPGLAPRLAARLLEHHLLRALVLAQAAEGGVTDHAVGGPGAELDLGHQLRPRELGPARFLSSEEHTSELQSLMRISYAVFCLKK